MLAPLADYVPNDTPKNNDSLVLRIRYGSRSFLLTGDVEKPIEHRMLDENEIAAHGRAESGAPWQPDVQHGGFPERRAIRAFAIISVGSDNSYGHPNREVLERLASITRRYFAPTGTGW